METIDYSVSFGKDALTARAKVVLEYWQKQRTLAAEKLQSMGPRPKDEKHHLSDWARLERVLQIASEHVWDAKIMICALDEGSDLGTWTFDSKQLRWLYPEISEDLIQSK